MIPNPDPKKESPAAPAMPADATTDKAAKEPVSDASTLSPEEQMERFAAELKEQDWGHQPC